MSVNLALFIAVLTLGSCFACYEIGRESMRKQIHKELRRRRQREEFRREWDTENWEDFDE